MKNNRENYIFGRPIKTEFGLVRFLKYYEYIENLEEITLLSLNVLHIYYQYKKMDDGSDPEVSQEIENIKERSLYEIVLSNDMFFNAYIKIFEMVLDVKENSREDIEELIKSIVRDEDKFMLMREIIMDMNLIKEDEVSPNSEIQKAIERSMRVKQRNSEKQSLSDMASSIYIATGNSYEEIANLTIFQFYASFYRLNQFKAYDTTILYSTVAEKVNIENWSKHINLFEKESHVVEHSNFKKTTGSVFED